MLLACCFGKPKTGKKVKKTKSSKASSDKVKSIFLVLLSNERVIVGYICVVKQFIFISSSRKPSNSIYVEEKKKTT